MSRDPYPNIPSTDWAKRVNRWIVHEGLAERAEEWLSYLEKLGDGRLAKSCAMCRTMSRIRRRNEDPKPWFYAGLFSLATAEEVHRFLSNHRLTAAVIPATGGDGELAKWVDRLGPDTRALVSRLR